MKYFISEVNLFNRGFPFSKKTSWNYQMILFDYKPENVIIIR